MSHVTSHTVEFAGAVYDVRLHADGELRSIFRGHKMLWASHYRRLPEEFGFTLRTVVQLAKAERANDRSTEVR